MVGAVGRADSVGPLVRGRAVAGGGPFRIGGATPEPAAASGALAGVDGVLLMQAVEDGPVRDRQARRHGRALLAGLAELQRALLGGDLQPGTLERMAALLDGCPQAADPALRATLDAVALRASLELARRGL